MKRLQVTPLPSQEPMVGRWLWAMEEARKRTLELVDGLAQDVVDWEGPDGDENAIGSLLYHIAEVEMAWLWWEMKGHSQMPEGVLKDFPHEPVDATGRLARVLRVPVEDHVARLGRSRQVFLKEAQRFSAGFWQTPRLDPENGAFEATPEWMLYHLIEHEAAHAAQIASLVRRAS